MKLGELAVRLECQLEGPEDLEISGVAGMDEAKADEITFLSNPKYAAQAAYNARGRDYCRPGRRHLGQARAAFRRSLHVLCAGAGGLLSAPTAARGNSSHCRHRPGRQTGKQSLHRSLCGHRSWRGNWRRLRSQELRDDLPGSENRRSILRPLPRRRAGERPHRQRRDPPERRGDWAATGLVLPRARTGRFTRSCKPAPWSSKIGVEIQANSCMDRAAVGETRLRRGVKVDNLVQVAHGCDIGENSLLCSQVGVSGSVKAGPERNSDRTGRRGRALDHRRPRHRHRAIRHSQRRSAAHDHFRLSRHREQSVAEGFGGL